MHISSDAALADVWLRQHLLRTVPELSHPELCDDARVSAVRRWIYRHLCAADDTTALGVHGVDVYSISPATVFWNSRTRAAGTFCDGTAEAARRIFELLGYRSCLFDMGDPLTQATHAVTLVELTHRGQKRVTVQDCYFGCTLRYGDGSLVDFSDLQTRLARGNSAGLHLHSDDQRKWLLYGAHKDVGSTLRHYGFSCERVVRLDDERQAALADWHLPGFISGEARYGHFIAQHHGSADPLWLFRWPIFVTPNRLGREIEAVLPSTLAVA